ncbi:MAG: Gfo/Idh/MocA family oxidoreductase [Candidatus Lokiarchaeota archaeon]|nr:Gfo/Idh/MocA family oxidoreductase [Candidatus Lokiarchaeota archaeon]
MEGVVKVGVTGTGFITKASHVPGFAKSSKSVITGFHDVKKELAEEAKSLYLRLLAKNKNPVLEVASKETAVYDSYEAMVKAVDVVDICTPPRFHPDNMKVAVDNGRHVICEKPLAINWWSLAGYQDVLKRLKEGRCRFMLHTQGIWHPIIKAGRDLIANGEIGDVERVRMLHQGSDPKHTVELPALWDRHHGGGGALVDIGPHAYAGMWYWLGGKCTPVSAEAKLVAAVIPERSIAGAPVSKVTVEDDAHVSITWKDPAGRTIAGDLEASWNKKDWFEGKPSGTDIFYEARGTKGTLSFPHVVASFPSPFLLAVAIKVTGDGGKTRLVKFPIPKAKVEDDVFFDEVADVVAGKVESRNDIQFAEDMLAVFGAAYLSRKNGGKVTGIDDFKRQADSVAHGAPSPPEQVKAIIDDLYAGF